MEILSFFKHYFIWHYSRAIHDIVGIARNFLWFLYTFFSISILLATFFSPWKRMNETYSQGFDLEGMFSSLIVNSLMRIVGMGMRALTILLGLICLAIACAASFAALVAWLLLPFLVVLLVYQGFYELLP